MESSILMIYLLTLYRKRTQVRSQRKSSGEAWKKFEMQDKGRAGAVPAPVVCMGSRGEKVSAQVIF